MFIPDFHFSSCIAKKKPHWLFHRTIFKMMKPAESYCENFPTFHEGETRLNVLLLIQECIVYTYILNEQ